MPTANTPVIKPGSISDRFLEFFRENPGYHRCQDLAPELRITTHKIAVASARLYDRGLIQRKRVASYGRVQEITYYGIPGNYEVSEVTE